jgi:dipeptidyl aminopeptidase/acylaminoacyl peptidase
MNRTPSVSVIYAAWPRSIFRRAGAAALSLAIGGLFFERLPALPAQEPALPVPPNVVAEGVPPVPVALADAIFPYGQFRRARLLSWHPTERRILIATRFDQPQLFDVRAPGGARRQLTFFGDGVAAPDERPPAIYEPDGRSFVFQKDTAGGGEANQLFRYDLASGTSTLLTDGRSKNQYPVMSRSGLVAFSTTRRNGKDWDIYSLNPANAREDHRRILEATGTWIPLDWSPDGRQLLVVELVSNAQMHLWLIDVASGARTALTDRTSPPARWVPASFTPDGKSILALSNKSGESTSLWRRAVSGNEWTAVTRSDEALEGFALSPDGRTLAVIVDRGDTNMLRLQSLSGRERPAVALPAGVISDLVWHPSGREVGFSLSGARMFHDVYSLIVDSNRLERWTWSEIGGANAEALPEAEVVRWKSFDNVMVSGILYRAPARFTGPRPVIINVHGGPDQRERTRALGRSNYFRNELGIALIYPNIRGSIGFGRTFEHLDDGLLRENAIKDIGALLDWIATQPGLDKNRVMIVGASYGGYVALASAIEYGDRLRCVQAAFAISDYLSYLETTDMSRQANRNAEYGNPEDPEVRKFLTKISPLTNAARLRIPLYLVHGARDTRIPQSQSDMMAKAVKAGGTPVWYVVYKDEGHLTLSPPNNNFNQYTWTLFVQKYLLNSTN